MKTFDVVISAFPVTHNVVVNARYHEEAEQQALLIAKVKWEDVNHIITTPREEPCSSPGKTS